jgi:hypothetical protein
MNKSMRYLVFTLLFAVVGFGVYSLMNKSTVSVDESSQVSTEAIPTGTDTMPVAQAEPAKQEEVIGDEAKEGEVKVEEMKKEGAEEPAVEETEETEESKL